MIPIKSLSDDLDLRAILDSMGHGVLIFDADDQLILDNAAARAILGTNLVHIRAEGWHTAAILLDAVRDDRPSVNEIRAKALRQAQPVRFHTFLAGAYTPCWATGVYGPNTTLYTMISIERPDWSALTELTRTFRDEARTSITSTRGHAELIKQITANRSETTTAEKMAQQIIGFAGIMSVHMYRLELLMDMLQRLEDVRTGHLAVRIHAQRKSIELTDFLEDLLEDITTTALIEAPDPNIDYRDRIRLDIPDNIIVSASIPHLTAIFRDLLRNSIMYSEPGTSITIRATPSTKAKNVQIDLVDAGHGIREKELARVFQPFQRARQPQVIAEFGYGLSLYLVKTEIEAMGGKIWFTSEEDVGTTFSFKLMLGQPAEHDLAN